MAGGNSYKIFTQVNFKLAGVDESVQRAKGRLAELTKSIADHRQKVADLESMYGKSAKARENSGWSQAEKDKYESLKTSMKALVEEQKTLNLLVKDGTRAYNVMKSAIVAQEKLTPKMAEELRRDIPKILKNINSLGEGAQAKIRQLAEVMRISEAEVKKFAAGFTSMSKPFKGETLGESKAFVKLFEDLGHTLAKDSAEYQAMAKHVAQSRENIAKIEGVIRNNTDAEKAYIDSLKEQIREEQKLQATRGTGKEDSEARLLSMMREKKLNEELGQYYAGQLGKEQRSNLSSQQLQDAITGAKQWYEQGKRYEQDLLNEYQKYIDFKSDPNHNALVSEKEFKDAVAHQEAYYSEAQELDRQQRDLRIQNNQDVVNRYEEQQRQILANGKINAGTEVKDIVLEGQYKAAKAELESDTVAKKANAEATERARVVLKTWQDQQAAGLDYSRDQQLSTWHATTQNTQALAERAVEERRFQKDLQDSTALLQQNSKAKYELTDAEKNALSTQEAERQSLEASNAAINVQLEKNRGEYKAEVKELVNATEQKREQWEQQKRDAEEVLSMENNLTERNARRAQKAANATEETRLITEAQQLRQEWKDLAAEKAAANNSENTALTQIKGKQDEIVQKEKELVELKEKQTEETNKAAEAEAKQRTVSEELLRVEREINEKKGQSISKENRDVLAASEGKFLITDSKGFYTEEGQKLDSLKRNADAATSSVQILKSSLESYNRQKAVVPIYDPSMMQIPNNFKKGLEYLDELPQKIGIIGTKVDSSIRQWFDQTHWENRITSIKERFTDKLTSAEWASGDKEFQKQVKTVFDNVISEYKEFISEITSLSKKRDQATTSTIQEKIDSFNYKVGQQARDYSYLDLPSSKFAGITTTEGEQLAGKLEAAKVKEQEAKQEFENYKQKFATGTTEMCAKVDELKGKMNDALEEAKKSSSVLGYKGINRIIIPQEIPNELKSFYAELDKMPSVVSKMWTGDNDSKKDAVNSIKWSIDFFKEQYNTIFASPKFKTDAEYRKQIIQEITDKIQNYKTIAEEASKVTFKKDGWLPTNNANEKLIDAIDSDSWKQHNISQNVKEQILTESSAKWQAYRDAQKAVQDQEAENQKKMAAAREQFGNIKSTDISSYDTLIQKLKQVADGMTLIAKDKEEIRSIDAQIATAKEQGDAQKVNELLGQKINLLTDINKTQTAGTQDYSSQLQTLTSDLKRMKDELRSGFSDSAKTSLNSLEENLTKAQEAIKGKTFEIPKVNTDELKANAEKAVQTIEQVMANPRIAQDVKDGLQTQLNEALTQMKNPIDMLSNAGNKFEGGRWVTVLADQFSQLAQKANTAAQQEQKVGEVTAEMAAKEEELKSRTKAHADAHQKVRESRLAIEKIEQRIAAATQKRTDAEQKLQEIQEKLDTDIKGKSEAQLQKQQALIDKYNEQKKKIEELTKSINTLTEKRDARLLTEEGSLNMLGEQKTRRDGTIMFKNLETLGKPALKAIDELWKEIEKDLKGVTNRTDEENAKLEQAKTIRKAIRTEEALRAVTASKNVEQLKEEFDALQKILETAKGATRTRAQNTIKAEAEDLRKILSNPAGYSDKELQQAATLSKEILNTKILTVTQQDKLNQAIALGNAELVRRSDNDSVNGWLARLGAKSSEISKFLDPMDKAFDTAAIKLKNLGTISDPLLQQMIRGMEGVINHAKDMGLEYQKDAELLKRLKDEEGRRVVEVGNVNAVDHANRVLKNPTSYSTDEFNKAIKATEEEMNRMRANGEKGWEAIAKQIAEAKQKVDTFNLTSQKIAMGKQFDLGLDKLSDDALQKQIDFWRKMEKAARHAGDSVEVYQMKVSDLQAQISKNAKTDISNLMAISNGTIGTNLAPTYKSGTLTAKDIENLNATQLKEMKENVQNLLNVEPTKNSDAIKNLNADLKVLGDQLDKLKANEGARQFATVWAEAQAVVSGNANKSVDDIKKLEKELEVLKGASGIQDTLPNSTENKVKAIKTMINDLKKMYGDSGAAVSKYGNLTDFTYQKIKNAAKAGSSALRKAFDEEKISIDDMRNALKRMRDEMNESKDATVNAMLQMGVSAQRLDKQVKELTDTEKNHVGTLENAADRLKNYVLVYVGFQQAVDYVTDKLKKNFELSDEIADIQKVTGLAREQIAGLSNDIEELNSRTSHSDLMKLAYQGGKMGIGSDAPNAEYQAQQLSSFVNTANQLNMALGEDFGGAQAIASLAKLTKVMKVQEQENVTMNEALEKTGSAILMLGNNSIASYNKISQFATRMGGIASSAHMAMPELLALGSTLDTFGAQSEMAATAMTKMISQLVKDPEKVARAVKAPVEEMQNLIWNGHITEGLELMFHSLKNNGAELSEIAGNLKDIVGGGNNTRAMQVLTEMANGADTFTQHLRMSRDAFEENSLVAEEYYIKNNTAMAYMERMQNTINEQFANSGGVEFFTNITKGLNDLTNRIEHFIPWVLARIGGVYIAVKGWNAGTIASWNSTFGALGSFVKWGYTKAFGEGNKAAQQSAQTNQQAAQQTEKAWTLAWRLIRLKTLNFHNELKGNTQKNATFIKKKIAETTTTLETNFSTTTGVLRAMSGAVRGLGVALKSMASSIFWMAAMQVAFEVIYQIYDRFAKGKSEHEAEKLQKFTEGLNENVNSVISNIDTEMKALEDKYYKAAESTDELTKATEKNTKASKENAEAQNAEAKAIKAAKQEQTDILAANEAYIKTEEARLSAKDAIIEKTFEQAEAEKALAEAQAAQAEMQAEYDKALAADRNAAANQAAGSTVDRDATTKVLNAAETILNARNTAVSNAMKDVAKADADAKADAENRIKRMKELHAEGVNVVAMMQDINALDRQSAEFAEKRDAIVDQYEAQAKVTNELLTQREKLIKAGADYKQTEIDIAKAEQEVTQAVNEMYGAYDVYYAEAQKGADISKQIAKAESEIAELRRDNKSNADFIKSINNPELGAINGVVHEIDNDIARSNIKINEAGNAFTKWYWSIDKQIQEWRRKNYVEALEQNKNLLDQEKRRYAEQYAFGVKQANQNIQNNNAKIDSINATIAVLKEQQKAQDAVTESAKGVFKGKIESTNNIKHGYGVSNSEDWTEWSNNPSESSRKNWLDDDISDVTSAITSTAIAAGQLKTELEKAGASYAEYLSMTAGKTEAESAAVKQLLLDRAALTKAGADYAKVEAEQAEAVKKITDAFNAYQTSVEAHNVAQKNLADTQKELKDAEAELAKETAILAQADAALNDPMKDKWVQGHKAYKDAKKALTTATKEHTAAIKAQKSAQDEWNRVISTAGVRNTDNGYVVAQKALSQANKDVARTTNEMTQAQKNLQYVADSIGADNKRINQLTQQIATQKEITASIQEHIDTLKEQQTVQATTLAAAEEGQKLQANAAINTAKAYGVEVDAIKNDEDATRVCTEAKNKIKDAAIEEAKAQDKAKDSTEEKTKAQKANKEVIDTINSAYGQYIGYILKETSANYELANSLAVVAAKRREDALAQAQAQVETKANEKYSDAAGTSSVGIKSGLMKGNLMNGGTATKNQQLIQKWIQDYMKKNQDKKYESEADFKDFNQQLQTFLKTNLVKTGANGKEEKMNLSGNDFSKIWKGVYDDARKYALNEKDRLDYISSMNTDIEARLETAHAEAAQAVKDYGYALVHGVKKGQKLANGKIAQEDEKGIQQLEKELAEARKNGTDSQKLREMQMQLNQKRTNYINFVNANWDSYTKEEQKQRQQIIASYERQNTTSRRTEGWDDFLDIEMKDPTEVKKSWEHLKKAWMGTGKGDGINPLQSETWKAFGDSVGQEFKSFEEAKQWQEDMRNKLKTQNEKFGDATPLAEWDTKKDKDKDKNKWKQEAKDKYEAYIKELDDYYVKEQTKIEKQRAEGTILQEQYQRMTERLESEHLDKRSRLRGQFIKNGQTLTKKEMEVLFRDNGKDIRKTGDLLLKMGDAMKDEIQLKADQDANKIAESFRKHRDAIEKVLEDNNPFLKLFNDTRKAMTDLGALLTMDEELDPAKAATIMQQRIAFLMDWVGNAYTKGAEELVAEIKSHPELSPWAAMLEREPQLAEAIVVKTRNMYEQIQDAVKKEAKNMQQAVDYSYTLEDDGGKSIKERFEEQTQAIERTQHAVEQYNSAMGGGYFAGKQADNLALKALKSKLAMQQNYLNLLRAEAEIRVANAQKAYDEAQGEDKVVKAKALDVEKKAYGQLVKDQTKAILDAQSAIDDKMTDMHYKMVSYIKSWGEWLGSSISSVMNSYGTEQNEKYNQLALNRYTGQGNTASQVYIIDNAGRKDASVRTEYMTENEQIQWEIDEENRQKQAEAWKAMIDSFVEKSNEQLNDILTASETNAAQAANTDATLENTAATRELTQAMGGADANDTNSQWEQYIMSMINGDTQTTDNIVNQWQSSVPVDSNEQWEQYIMALAEGHQELADSIVQSWQQAGNAAEGYGNRAKGALDSVNNTNTTDGNKMVNTTKGSFSAMMQAANLYGAAYQAVSNNNLSASQKAATIGLQAAGQAAMAMLTMDLSKDTAKTASSLPAILAECLKISPIAGAAIFAGLTALLGAGMAVATSAVTKSKSEIASVSGASQGKLATGMLTYAKGRLPLYADGDLTPSLSQGEGAAARSVAGARYQVQGADGQDYSAAFEKELQTKLYQGGAHFGIFSEKKPEIVIGGDDTAKILSQYPYLYDGILAVHRGQDPRLSMDYGYIQDRLESMSRVQKMSVAKAAFGRMPAFAEGNLDSLSPALSQGEVVVDTLTGEYGNGGGQMGQTLALMNQLLTSLVEDGVSAGVEIGGKHGLDKQTAKYNRWKKRMGLN